MIIYFISFLMQQVLPQNLKCLSQNVARLACTSKKCNQVAFSCANQSCVSCYQSHKYCRTFWTKSFLQLFWKKKLEIDEQAMKTMRMAEQSFQQLIQQLKTHLKTIRNRMKFYGMTEIEANLAEKLENEKYSQIVGKQISNIFSKLHEPSEPFTSVESYNKFKQKKISEIKATLEQFKNTMNSKATIFDSKIVKDFSQITKYFDIPIASAKLLYRASENSYSAYQFHEQCDGKINTLTILRTQDGNILGGFTPIPWTKDYCYYYDSTSMSFIFSLSIDKKLKLLSKSRYAIYSTPDCGPTFGDNNDLLISNNSNQNQSSYFCPGSCYENVVQHGQQQQQKLNEILGAKRNGNNFRVDQWQVYEIQFLYYPTVKMDQKFISETLRWQGGGGGGG